MKIVIEIVGLSAIAFYGYWMYRLVRHFIQNWKRSRSDALWIIAFILLLPAAISAPVFLAYYLFVYSQGRWPQVDLFGKNITNMIEKLIK